MSRERSDSGSTVDRRTFLKGVAGVAGVSAASYGATPAAAQSAFGGWFENVSNYEGVVDATGESEVTVEVGAQGNNGAFAFGPAAVRVDPGTTVVWEWTGEGGSHNVVAEDGAFESELVGQQGHTFEQTFDEEGVVKYACTPHEAMGMKGAIVVGTDAASSAQSASGSSEAESSGSESAASSESASPASGTAGGSVTATDELLTLGFAGAVVAGLLGLPLAEMRSRRTE